MTFVLAFFVGEGIDEGFEGLLHLTVRESAMMAAFVVVWLGSVVGWKWELAGGLLTVGGMAAFCVLDWVFSGSFPRGVYFPLMASPGVLFVVYGLWKRAGASDGHRELRETAGKEATKDAKGSTDMEKG